MAKKPTYDVFLSYSRSDSSAAEVLAGLAVHEVNSTVNLELVIVGGSAAWLDSDTLLLSSAGLGATQSGYASTVRLWRRGEAPGEPLFTAEPGDMMAYGSYDRDADRVLFHRTTDFFNGHLFLGDRAGPRQHLDLPTDAQYTWHGDWLAVKPRMRASVVPA